MRIGIDARYLSHGLVGGVHTYLQNLLPELLALAGEHQVYLYADTKHPFELTAWPGNVTLRLLPYRNGFSSFVHDWKTLREAMTADRVEVAHFPANYGFGPRTARTLITVHDEINLLPLIEIWRGHRKDPRTLIMMTYLHFSTRAAVRQAHQLITVSEYARQQIARISGFPVDKITPVYHAPTPDLRRVTDPAVLAEVRRRHHLPERFILDDGSKKFIPAVGYSGTEDWVDNNAVLDMGPLPVVKVFSDETEIAYSFFRNGQTTNPPPSGYDAVGILIWERWSWMTPLCRGWWLETRFSTRIGGQRKCRDHKSRKQSGIELC